MFRLAAIPLLCIPAAVLALSSAASAQWNEEVLYSFQGIPDGVGPIGRIGRSVE